MKWDLLVFSAVAPGSAREVRVTILRLQVLAYLRVFVSSAWYSREGPGKILLFLGNVCQQQQMLMFVSHLIELMLRNSREAMVSQCIFHAGPIQIR